MRFHLIVSTIRRSGELRRFLESACDQTHQDFEIVIVDQNEDDRVALVLEEFAGRLALRHVRSPGRGLSLGRNVGLGLEREADAIAFPDDDCWYAPDLLARVAELFRMHPDWQGITGRSMTQEGRPSNGRWHSEAGRVTPGNAWNRATSFSIFLRNTALRGAAFDESLGVGADTLWGGGEDLDFLLQVIRSGHPVFFEPGLAVYHPEWSTSGYTAVVCEKARAYGRGMGRVLRKHGYPCHLVAYHLIRPFGGTLLSLAKGNCGKAKYHWSVFAGRLHGWSAPLPVAGRRLPSLKTGGA